MSMSAKRRAAIRRRQGLKRIARLEKNGETAALRQLVFQRAGGRCEARLENVIVHGVNVPCGKPASSMDHFFGRGHVKQALSNCWALCKECDVAKTEGKPSRTWWLHSFLHHARLHAYLFEFGEVLKELEAEALIVRASAMTMGVGR
jgi:hypothetical protein